MKRKSKTPRPQAVPSPSGYLVPQDRTMPAIPVEVQDPKPLPPAPGWENLCKDATDAGLAMLLREIVQVRRVADRKALPTHHLGELVHRATVIGFHLDPAPPVQYGQWHAKNTAEATRSEFLRAATAILRRFADGSAAARTHRRPLLAWDRCDKDDEARLLEIADALDGGKAEGGNDGVPAPMPKSARAMAILILHPDWTNKRIAEAVHCNPKSMSRWPLFVAARRKQAEGRKDLPCGTRLIGKDDLPQVEAWDGGRDDDE